MLSPLLFSLLLLPSSSFVPFLSRPSPLLSGSPSFLSSSTPDPPEYEPPSFGSTTPGKLERLEFTISRTGLVTEHVTGMVGPSCLVVTTAINKQLGRVVKVEDTEEMLQVITEVDINVKNEEYGQQQ